MVYLFLNVNIALANISERGNSYLVAIYLLNTCESVINYIALYGRGACD